MQKISQLKQHFPYSGNVQWIGIRPSKGSDIIQKSFIKAVAEHGLEGDKAGQRPGGKRQVTLIQAEYMDVIRSLMPQTDINLADLRRNIAISGINLNALKDCVIQIGNAKLEITGFCHPCSKLEAQLGEGVFNALRGHGGLTAKVIEGGPIQIGDQVQVLNVN